jgi:Zn finger protein HypA/HybF involved in hydrogenase expression
MDKDLLVSYINQGLSTTRIAQLTNKGQSTIRYWLKKYNLKTTKRTFTLEKFIEAVKNNYSVSSSLVYLNLSPTGANYRGFYKFQKENSIDISHFTGQGHLKDKNHNYNTKIPLSKILVKNYNYSSNKLRKRLISEGLKEHKCECCGLSEWLGELIPLELDHIDGDHYNNILKNLKILCPNCHAKTPTYRGRNIKNKNLKTTKTKKKRIGIKKEYNCSCCGCELKSKHKSKSGLCKDCHSKLQRKVERPSKEQLIKEVEESSYLAVGRKYGVSDNSIRKWIK